jgi:hypothetical protein
MEIKVHMRDRLLLQSRSQTVLAAEKPELKSNATEVFTVPPDCTQRGQSVVTESGEFQQFRCHCSNLERVSSGQTFTFSRIRSSPFLPSSLGLVGLRGVSWARHAGRTKLSASCPSAGQACPGRNRSALPVCLSYRVGAAARTQCRLGDRLRSAKLSRRNSRARARFARHFASGQS